MGNAMENVGRSLIGNVAKAILCVRNPKALPAKLNKPANGDDVTQEEKDAIAAAKGLHSDLMEKAADALKEQKTLSFKEVSSAAKGGEGQNKYIALEVQYNPSTIRFDTTAGRQMNYGGEGANSTLQQYIAPASTTLSCELLFNDVNTMDAFMLSDLPLSVGQIVSLGKSIYSNSTDKLYSVQDQLEGLISLMAVPEAKQVIFFWGNMSFRGEMVQVTTTYTMFNKKGAPIRGKASIAIRQGDSSKADEAVYEYDTKYWDDAFTKLFSFDRGKQSTLSKATNNNLFNLHI